MPGAVRRPLPVVLAAVRVTGAPVRVCVFRDAFDQCPRQITTTWGALCAWFAAKAPIIEAPLARPAWGPYSLIEGAIAATNVTVDAVYMLVLDIDGVDTATTLAAAGRLRDMRVEAIVHTTWSHDPTPDARGDVRWRLRVVVLLARPIAPSRLANARERLASFLGLPNDTQTVDVRRLYFLPCRKAAAGEPGVWIFDGSGLDVWRLSDTNAVDARTIVQWARKLTHKRGAADGTTATGAAIVLALADGVPYAEEGQRDATAWRIACAIAQRWPRADPEAMAAMFDVASSQWADGPDMREKMHRAFGQTAAARRETEINRVREFWAAFPGQSGRTEVYNGHERDTIRAAYDRGNGIKWILQSPDGWHYLTLRGYTEPHQPDAAALVAARELAPAPVRLESDDGPLPISVLARTYGAAIETPSWSLYEPRLGDDYDEGKHTLTICRTRLRNCGGPLRSTDVEAYLDALGSPSILTAWLSMSLDLRRILPALYLWGEKGAGKSFFARAVASPWSVHGATDGALIISDSPWTSPLLECPVLRYEESFPTIRGNAIEEFKLLVGSYDHKYTAKYAHSSKIIGAVRVILTANNPWMLSAGVNFTVQSFDALVDRVICVHTPDGAGRYLDGLGDERRREMLAEGFYRHVLYLAQVPATKTHERFWISDPSDDFATSLAVTSGLGSLICQAIFECILPVGFRRPCTAVVTDSGRVFVNAAALYEAWGETLLKKKERRPQSVALLVRWLGILSSENTPRSDHYEIDASKLRAYADYVGVSQTKLAAAIYAPKPHARVTNIR